MAFSQKLNNLWNTALAWVADICFPDPDEAALRAWLSARKGMRWHIPFLHEKGQPNIPILALFPYRDPVMKKAVRKLKYRGNVTVARLCAEALIPLVSAVASEQSRRHGSREICIIPIPSFKAKMRKKGFNQSFLLADCLLKAWADNQKDKWKDGHVSFIKVAVRKDVLMKIKDTKAQVEVKDRRKRLSNLKDCFAVRNGLEGIIHKASIILIDDVTTTGTTFREGAIVLAKAGAASVTCIALAH